jgi:transposase
MKKQADSIQAPQPALAVPMSTSVRRHRRKAELRQHVIQESQNGERRTIAATPAADVPTGMNLSTMTFGVDIGDKKSNYCLLDPEGQIVREGSFNTTREGVMKTFADLPPARIAFEVSAHSGWMSEILDRAGHEVIVANPRKVRSIYASTRKNDRMDARKLARLARLDPELLYPIRHRSRQARQDLILIRAREQLVKTRTLLVNAVRGLVKSVGGRLPASSSEYFHLKAKDLIPEELQGALLPLLDQIASLTKAIRGYDEAISSLAATSYGETVLLQQVQGVGALTALTFMLTIESPDRFQKSRDVGPYFGLVPKQHESGDSSPQLRITKTGDMMVRRLLVGSSHFILGPFGEDSDLRRFGLGIAERGGRNAKKRAVVAVARKLAVLLHRLWVTGEVYQPCGYKTQKPAIGTAA